MGEALKTFLRTLRKYFSTTKLQPDSSIYMTDKSVCLRLHPSTITKIHNVPSVLHTQTPEVNGYKSFKESPIWICNCLYKTSLWLPRTYVYLPICFKSALDYLQFLIQGKYTVPQENGVRGINTFSICRLSHH